MSAKSRPFSVVEASIPEMRHALQHKQVTSRELVQQYLSRIEQYNRTLNAVITLNPRALEEAGVRDRERAQGKARGPLHDQCTMFRLHRERQRARDVED